MLTEDISLRLIFQPLNSSNLSNPSNFYNLSNLITVFLEISNNERFNE